MGSDLTLCSNCEMPIDPERLEAIPETTTCVRCSTVKKQLGLMEYGHKTAGTIVLLPDDEEQQRLAFRSYRRSR